ncbi:hypothetical protein PW5551_07505 [Petrotoga sp. 9PW.55.5.1]|jgi:hypothetical protein|uniref:hypothetical protein n=1 Tax=Petrotoga sp. 9PW.55.5.1 TaxID=1308979 RepID=UPI000DC3B302|nr:hypothetical protein [Petrotoga sp. 9PW.55.5.1]RAO98915.1 hypothetical protein PW5551_07505 [Petrotoga sp. 9PW.55.5.1]
MLGYFSLYKSDEEKYSGGLLIMNENGIPVSFKYTEPIKPTKIQKIIYGNNLKNYLAFQILNNNELYKPFDIDLILTDDSDLLNYIDIDKPIMFIVEISSDKGFGVKEKEGAIPLNEEKSLKFYSTKIVDSVLLKKLKSYVEVFDIFEPFTRLKEALIYICSSQEK